MNVKHINYDKAVILEGETLRRYQLEILNIVKDIVSVCDENNIFYQLSGGSALGAVRHHGFIPWDDDIDLNMLDSQFDHFIKCFKQKFDNKYWIHTCHTNGHGLPVNKIRLKGSVARINEDVNNPESGFFVDIFLIENLFDNIILRKIHGVFCMGFGYLLSCRKYYSIKKIMLDIAGNDKKAKRNVHIRCIIGFLLSFLSLKVCAEITQRCYGLVKNNNSEYVSIPSGRKHYFGEMYERKKFLKSDNVAFEDCILKVTSDYDNYFKKLYGDDYMIPAKKENQEHHILLELVFPTDNTKKSDQLQKT